MVEIQGIAGIPVTEQRSQGFRDALKRKCQDGVKIVASQPADFVPDKGLSVMENILQAQKEIDAVYTHDDDMAEGVVSAIQNAGREDEMFLTGAGGSKAAMDQIKEGGLYRATFLYNPSMSASAIRMARKIVRGEGFEDLTEPEVPQKITVPGDDGDQGERRRGEGARLLSRGAGRHRAGRAPGGVRPVPSLRCRAMRKGIEHGLLRPGLADRRPRRRPVLPRRPRVLRRRRASSAHRGLGWVYPHARRSIVFVLAIARPAHGQDIILAVALVVVTTIQVYAARAARRRRPARGGPPAAGARVLGLAAHIGRRYIGGAAGGGSGAPAAA